MEYMHALQGTFDDAKPSLFELLAEQQLAGLIPPSLRYLLAVTTHRHPRYLLRVLNSFDELYALLMLAVERYYLTTYGGSFTEHFYGLKRQRAVDLPTPRADRAAPSIARDTFALSSADVWKNLAVMVGLPYLKCKLDESYEVNAPRALLGQSYSQLPPNPTLRQRFLHYYRWFLRHIYPSVNAAYYFSLLAFNLAYLFDNSQYHSPLLWLVRTRMRRLGAADYRAIAELEEASAAAGSRPGVSLLHPQTLVPRVLGSLKVLLPASIFALKFLEWWHASDFARQLSRKVNEGLELPPPLVSGLTRLADQLGPGATNEKAAEQTGGVPGPADDASSPTDDDASPLSTTNPPIAASTLLPILTVRRPADSRVCPICADEVETPTACPTGFVFCYACIHKWVEGSHVLQETFMADQAGKWEWESGKGRCAVTGRRILGGTEGLRRLMV